MKKFVIVAVVTVFIVGGLPVFAQAQEGETDSGPRLVTVFVERIWPHHLGYVVEYRRANNRIGRAYLPIEWFGRGDSRGELIWLPRANSWPSMSVVFRDGEFSALRLYIHRAPLHETWGILPQGINLRDNFGNVETLEIGSF